MSDLAPIYLVHGDDDARIDAWRGRLRARAESERGPGGLRSFDARASEPDAVAAALGELTFEPGTRYLLVDDAGTWKAAQLAPLEQALAEPPPETVLVLIVRGKPLKALVTLAERAGAALALRALAHARAPGVDAGVVVAVDQVEVLQLGHFVHPTSRAQWNSD